MGSRSYDAGLEPQARQLRGATAWAPSATAGALAAQAPNDPDRNARLPHQPRVLKLLSTRWGTTQPAPQTVVRDLQPPAPAALTGLAPRVMLAQRVAPSRVVAVVRPAPKYRSDVRERVSRCFRQGAARRRRRRRSGRRRRSISLPTALNSAVLSGAQRRNARCSPGLSAAPGSPRSDSPADGLSIRCTSAATGRIRATLAPFRRSTSTRAQMSLSASRSSLCPYSARYPMVQMPGIPPKAPAPRRLASARTWPRRPDSPGL